MSVSTPPPPAPPASRSKKAGLGCCGCGCLLLIVLLVLILGLCGGLTYLAYDQAMKLTTTAAADVPVTDGGETVFRSTQQKIADFDHDVKNHQAATIRLSADEINTLLAENPEVKAKKVRVHVSFTGSEARLQCTFPTDAVTMLHALAPGRHANIDTSFEVLFDPGTKNIIFDFHTLDIGPTTLIGDTTDASPNAKAMARSAAQFQPVFNQMFNEQIRKFPDGAALLDQAKMVKIENGELVIETQ